MTQNFFGRLYRDHLYAHSGIFTQFYHVKLILAYGIIEINALVIVKENLQH
jgi:hypothetical protein